MFENQCSVACAGCAVHKGPACQGAPDLFLKAIDEFAKNKSRRN